MEMERPNSLDVLWILMIPLRIDFLKSHLLGGCINYTVVKSPMRGNHKSSFHYQMKHEAPRVESINVDFFFLSRWVRER